MKSFATVITDEYILAARQWLLSCNRSVLGSFAYDDFEYLLLWHAWTLAAHEYQSGKNTSLSPVIKTLNARIHRYQKTWDKEHDSAAASDEVLFWWSISDDAFLSEYSAIRTARVGSMERLQAIYDFPARLPYFEAGLIDIDAMDKFIADGIDSHIAGALQA